MEINDLFFCLYVSNSDKTRTEVPSYRRIKHPSNRLKWGRKRPLPIASSRQEKSLANDSARLFLGNFVHPYGSENDVSDIRFQFL